MTGNNNVLIVGEIEEGKITLTTKELLGVGGKIAGELGSKLSVLLLGHDIDLNGEEAIVYGADDVFLVDDAQLSQYSPDYYTDSVTRICQQKKPSIIIMGQTAIGRDIAPRIAYRLNCSICMDCIKLSINQNDRVLIQTRVVYGGNALAEFTSKDSQVCVTTVRPRAMAPNMPDTSRKGEIEHFKIESIPLGERSRLTDTVKYKETGIRVEDAKVIIAGGGGIGGAEGFRILEDLANICRGAVGNTRVPCDEGWVPTKNGEIGISGKTVRPQLYFAVGIRGASQHLAGCSDAKCMVAINVDPDATIFKFSDYGIVGDYKVILPEIINELEKAG